ncbi:MAG: hypothetical protein RLZ91_777 [Bacteroidota bacterium]|jgi:acetyl esterase/lipase
MKGLVLTLLLMIPFAWLHAQKANPVLKLLPEGTRAIENVAYAQDTLQKHLLDIYLPPKALEKMPVLILIHGGGWVVNDKYADIGYMGNTVSSILQAGIAVVSIDYRFATQARFPAQIQDCYQAMSFISMESARYNLDPSRIAIMGFSAGGHLASLVGLANNQGLPSFYVDGKVKPFAIKAVVDYYGPSELTSLGSSEDPKAPEALLIGDSPVARPDLAKIASPVSYVDKNDPPFLIFHGEKDQIVTNRQSKLLSSWLRIAGVKQELIIVPDAPHFGKMYDVDTYKDKVIHFLNEHLNVNN